MLAKAISELVGHCIANAPLFLQANVISDVQEANDEDVAELVAFKKPL